MANKGRGMVTSVIDFNAVEVYEAGALLITSSRLSRREGRGMGTGSRVPLQLCAQNKICIGARSGHCAATDKANLRISPGTGHQAGLEDSRAPDARSNHRRAHGHRISKGVGDRSGSRGSKEVVHQRTRRAGP